MECESCGTKAGEDRFVGEEQSQGAWRTAGGEESNEDRL